MGKGTKKEHEVTIPQHEFPNDHTFELRRLRSLPDHWPESLKRTDSDHWPGLLEWTELTCFEFMYTFWKHGRKSCQPVVAFICICLLLLLAGRRRHGRFRNISSCTADDQYHEGNLSIPCKSSLRHGLEVGMRETRLCLSCNMGFVGVVHGANHG